MKHSRMELMLLIDANNKNLNDVDKSEIVMRTFDIYLKKKKKKNFQKLNHQDIFHSSNHNHFDTETKEDDKPKQASWWDTRNCVQACRYAPH